MTRPWQARPVEPEPSVGDPAAGGGPVSEFITSLDPAFRAEELSYAVSLVAHTVELTAAAERRSWRERWLGRQPEGVPGTLSAARERITSYLEPHSVWLHNSLRGAAGLGLAVLAARLTGVQHSFWVILGALSVLRSNALNTGQDAVRAMLGTVAGFLVGAALLVGIGTNTTLLWFLLPLAVFLAGVAPACISFAGGQAAFTLTVVILFSILQPTGWRVGLVRIEDVALGVGVSLVVGVLFWPRGARPRSARRWRRRTPTARATSPARCDSGCHAATQARPRSPFRAATRSGPRRHRAGSMTRSARTWPSAVRNGSRWPMWPGWSPGSPDCAWRLTRYWTSGEATTGKQAATWPLHAMRFWAPLNASRAGTTVSRAP